MHIECYRGQSKVLLTKQGKNSRTGLSINGDKITPEKYKVNKMFAGHIHNLLNYSISGIPITVTGGAGGPSYNIPLIGRDGHHYIDVEVSDGNFKQKVIEL